MSDLIYHILLETVHCLVDSVYYHVMTIIQDVFFNWPPPKNYKFKKKVEYPDWPPLKSLSVSSGKVNSNT